MATEPANVKISLANRYSRLRPASNENRLVGRPLGVAYGTRLPSRDVRIHGESGGTESDTFGHYVAILVGKIDPG